MRRLVFVLAVLCALPALAKSLHWRAVDVKARLEANGNLHLVESLTFVFDGDWNGGERSFNLRDRQEVQLRSLTLQGGAPLEEDDLDAVGEYQWSGNTLRWRSRLPTDPPFANAERTYVIDYVLTNVLEGDGQGYRLHHDFGLPEANLPIERFSLELTFDPAWQDAAPVAMPPVSMRPGQSMVVTRNMTFGGAGEAPAVHQPTPMWVGVLALFFFLGGAALLLLVFLLGERASGRMKLLPYGAHHLDEVLELRAEAAGAAWDGKVGENEVAATLARLTQEGKITSRVEDGVLHMRLEVSRSELHGYERALISHLFAGKRNETDTDSIRAHYASQGFDPAELIRPGIEQELTDREPFWSESADGVSAWPHVAAFSVAVLMMIGSAIAGTNGDILASILAFVIGTVFGMAASVYAASQAKRVADISTAIAIAAVIYAPSLLVFLLCSFLTRLWDLHALTPFALAMWHLAWLHLILDLLRIRDTAEKLAFRRKIAAVRMMFAQELDRPQPNLRDEWFPYLIAFGLGKSAARWFRSFGSAIEYNRGVPTSSSSSSSSSSGSSSPSWTGGGGAFGGAGATGSWAAAAAVVSSGVSAPSSSGSGGGSSSGGSSSSSSSGGGGSGGW